MPLITPITGANPDHMETPTTLPDTVLYSQGYCAHTLFLYRTTTAQQKRHSQFFVSLLKFYSLFFGFFIIMVNLAFVNNC